MKSNLFFALILTASFLTTAQSFAAGNSNPQIRTCHVLGGNFLEVQSGIDQIGLCQFGKAMVGALDLTLFNNKESISKSLNAYLKSQTSCTPPGKIQTLSLVGGAASFAFCAFPDNSLIELATLLRGQNSSENELFNQALGL